jgi:hypothetical protein
MARGVVRREAHSVFQDAAHRVVPHESLISSASALPRPPAIPAHPCACGTALGLFELTATRVQQGVCTVIVLASRRMRSCPVAETSRDARTVLRSVLRCARRVQGYV